jgi:hypothetical protein
MVSGKPLAVSGLEARRQLAEIRGQMSEDRGQRAEGRRQRKEERDYPVGAAFSRDSNGFYDSTL